jgi:hypothetical protein
MSKQISINFDDDGLRVIRSVVEDFDENAGAHFVSEAVLIDTMKQVLENDMVISLDDEDYEILMSIHEKMGGDKEFEGEGAVIASLINQIAASGRVTCDNCGSDTFSGTFHSWYSETEWCSTRSIEPIHREFANMGDAAEAAWSRLIDGQKADDDDDWPDYDDAARTATDVKAQVTCTSCGDPLELATELFPQMGGSDYRRPPMSVVAPWSPSLKTLEGAWPWPEIENETDPKEGIPCSLCREGRIEVFGETVSLRESAGKQSGTIEFKSASTNESPFTWDSRLECEGYDEKVGGDEDDHPAAMGFRAGVGCSSDGCWEARGLKSFTDIPAAFLAANAIASAYRSFSGLELLDLEATAKDMETDEARRGPLTKLARSWLDLGAADSEVLEHARELLGD